LLETHEAPPLVVVKMAPGKSATAASRFPSPDEAMPYQLWDNPGMLVQLAPVLVERKIRYPPSPHIRAMREPSAEEQIPCQAASGWLVEIHDAPPL
jgi:hypothetical protein